MREREETARVLAHLAEVERRKLHLQRGYSSLFTYAREGLKYSEFGAVRRVAAARLVLEFPERLEAIARGRLTLTAAMDAWRTFEELRKTKPPMPASEPLQASMLPALAPPSASTPMPAPARQTEPLTHEAKQEILDALESRSRDDVKRTLQGVKHAARGTTPENQPERPRGCFHPHSKRWERLELYLSSDERARFDRLRELLSHALPGGDPVAVFLRLVEEGLDRHDPVRQEERARKRTENRKSKPGVKRHWRSASDKHGASEPVFPFERLPIPKATRRQVWLRDQSRCRYVDPESGRRCEATHHLDIDHLTPVSEGGGNELENLRLACASHNRHRAQWEAA